MPVALGDWTTAVGQQLASTKLIVHWHFTLPFFETKDVEDFLGDATAYTLPCARYPRLFFFGVFPCPFASPYAAQSTKKP
mmetsp:Transcript_75808/g.126231  ORF Transcript_75808/g.126231 Transcript_75808/m.126231 type:complete len:80 (+) Transcript_75808:63-302(+)